MKKRTKVMTTVLASAIGLSALSVSAFAYNDNIKNLVYTGVNKIVTATTPSIQADLNAHQTAVNTQVNADVLAAKDQAVNALTAYKAQLIQWGIDQQNAQYAANKAAFDQDVAAAIENGKAQLAASTTTIVNTNKSVTDATYEAALNALVNP